MPVRIARDVDVVGPLELRGIAVGGADHDVKNLALADVAAVDVEILPRGADAALGRRLVAQEFLRREIDQLRVAP